MSKTITTAPICWNDLGDNIKTLSCPICDEIWIRDGDEYDPSVVEPCKHLKFRLVDKCGVEWFGRWNHESFVRDYVKSYLQVCDDPNINDGIISFDRIDEYTTNALNNIEADDIHEVLILEEDGLACGPCSMTIMYGVL